MFLFPLIVGVRALKNIAGLKDAKDDQMPSAAVNAALKSIFGFERNLINYINFPIGVSLLAVAEKRR